MSSSRLEHHEQGLPPRQPSPSQGYYTPQEDGSSIFYPSRLSIDQLEIGDQPKPETSFPEGGRQAWMVAAGTGCVLFCGMGYTNTFGVFQAHYMAHQLQDETADRIAWIGSLQSFLILAAGIAGGPLFDRYGAKIILPGAVLFLFAVMMTSLCGSYWEFMLAQGVLTGIACSLMLFPSMAATSQYFNKRRGAAIGIAIAGSSLGGVVFPVLLSQLLTESSVSFAWSIRICAFIMIPLLAFACVVIKARLPPRKSKLFLPEAFRVPMFNWLVVAEFCLFVGMFTPLMFIPTYAITRGMNETLASYLVAILNGASIFGRIIPGIMADKLGRLNLLFAAGFSTAVISFCWSQVQGTAGIIIFTIIFGFCSGGIISGSSVALTLCPKDPKDTGTYMGQGMAIAALSILMGPPVTGHMLDQYGGFLQISIFGGVFTIVGSAFVLVAKMYTTEGILGMT